MRISLQYGEICLERPHARAVAQDRQSLLKGKINMNCMGRVKEIIASSSFSETTVVAIYMFYCIMPRNCVTCLNIVLK